MIKVKEQVKGGSRQDWWWEGSIHGEYTIKSGYKWLIGRSNPWPWERIVWNKVNIPNQAFILWLTLTRRQTKDKIQRFKTRGGADL